MKKFLLFAAAFLAMNASAQTVLLDQNFDGEVADWAIADQDGDGNNWGILQFQDSNGAAVGTPLAVSFSYDNATYTALTPDNWLMAPAVTLGQASKLTYKIGSVDASYLDYYGVFIAVGEGDFEQLIAETAPNDATDENVLGLVDREIDLANYAGQEVTIAFRHFNSSDMFALGLDDVKIVDEAATAIDEVKANNAESNIWFDLQGRAYNQKPAAAGLYIHNGKKVIIK